MHILLSHNFYQQPGGEDAVYQSSASLLEAKGNCVSRFVTRNETVAGMNPLSLACATVWNQDVYRRLRNFLRLRRPAVAHFHNTFPLTSPAAYYAAKAEKVAVVQTLHNYRLMCPNAVFFRDGRVCEECLGKTPPWPGVAHGCYRGSRMSTAAVAGMLSAHRAVGTWRKKVDVYVALTEFARRKFIEGGLPAERVVVSPNFLYPDPGVGEREGQYALFVGRLTAEKGLDTLLSAWQRLGRRVPLRIVGDGPLATQIGKAVARMDSVEYLGRQSGEQVRALMKRALALVFPSIWYEGFPMTVVESFAVGLPVIASNLGSLACVIEDGRTGLHFKAGDAEELEAKVDWALSHPTELKAMGREARAEYETKYTAEHNYSRMMEIYARAMCSQ